MFTPNRNLTKDGQSWLCSSGLPSDIVIQVEETSFHLHKFPLLSRSRALENLIGDSSDDERKGVDNNRCVLQLHDLPGRAKTFLLVAKFCYGVKMDLTAKNVVSLRCAAEYLEMYEENGEGNLVTQTETFLNAVFANWIDTIKALETCEEVLPHAEELRVVSRCIDSLALRACSDQPLFIWPVSGRNAAQSPASTLVWNGIRTAPKAQHMSEDWWYEDVSFLRLPLYKRLILAVGSRGMKPERIAGSLIFYAKKYLPLMGRQSNSQNGNRAGPQINLSASTEADQRILLEEIVELLPDQKGVISTKLLLKLLRTSLILHASQSCRENLEKRVGTQLDQAVLVDLLIPSMGYSVETLYDIDCVQRILDHFMTVEKDAADTPSNGVVDEEQFLGISQSLSPLTLVANLVDSYLAEVAPDVNLKLPKFQSLAAVLPPYSRQLDDGIYRAIDIYLKAHPWLTDSEREQLCRLMNCEKLSLEASTHAAQNERLPLRVIVQVLFFEQLRLRTSVSNWFFVSDNDSQVPSGNLALPRTENTVQPASGENQIVRFDDMKERVFELEKECMGMKEEIDRIMKTKGSWNSFFKLFGLKLKMKSSEPKAAKKKCSAEVVPPAATTPLLNGKPDEAKGELVH
ncbi:BTB/POZ domain-containing protein At5g03250 isoform X2 [Daucus carota subsp. sativus]|uniref:BTB/POZ domain-containing protein At5g03250 isoform X2 n=1 Tax=Daucus carota subsp. sativus TaxID=79200 RepID=UPI0007EF421F|nr:PREDICTED: BTB/POZ domain-containing protein At5g03250 isoform X2 [Daucus carota subsp. sativus]